MNTPTYPVGDRNRRLPRCRRGFTLVELLIVLVILGALTAIAVRAIRDHAEEARVAAMASVVRTAQSQIDLYCAQHSAYPPTVDPAWFQGELSNTWHPAHATPLWLSPDPVKRYPSNKVLTQASASTLWYTPFFGRFYARVPAQATDAETIDLFNRVNGTRITALDQIE